MKRKLRGLQRRALDLDFDLYRVDVPIRGLRNAELSVIDMEPEGAEHCLVFVHGYAGCLETWEAQISAFARNHRVVAPDLRGHGQSDAPYTRYTLDELVSDLETIVNALDLPPRFSLVGHSFGGAVAAAFALRNPERVSRLVLVATPVSFPIPASVSVLRRIPTAVYRPFWRFRPRWNAEPHVLKRMMLNAMLPWDGSAVLSKIQTPTLIITGDRDTYFPKRVFEGSIEAMPEAEVINVGASKHKVQLERHQAVNRGIARFLDARASSWRDAGSIRALRTRRPWLSLYHELTPPTLPLPRQPLDSFLARAAENHPRRSALRFRGRKMSYQALDRRVNQVARAIHGLGLLPGDRVLVALPNCPELVTALYGIWRAGCVALIPPLQTEADALVTLGERYAAKILLTESTVADYQSLILDVEDSPAAPQANSESEALILMSRDQLPEHAVHLTHGNLVANAVQLRHWLPSLRDGEERCLAAVPIAQSFGMTVALNLPIMLAATVELLPDPRPETVLKGIRDSAPSFLPGVPTLFAALNQTPALHRFGIGKVKLFLSGTSPLPVEVHEAFEKLSKSKLIELYGLREACAVTHANPLGERRYAGLIGLPLPNTESRIVDERTGLPLEPGEVGEIQVRGPQVASFTGNEGDDTKNGWQPTGDIGIMEADGSFRFLSRAGEWIIVNDRRIFPRDIEEALIEHHDIHEIAVVAGKHPSRDASCLCAFVVARPQVALDPATLHAFAERRLPAELRPARIEILERLPKDPLGRIDRGALACLDSKSLNALDASGASGATRSTSGA